MKLRTVRFAFCLLEIMNSLLSALAEEMGAALGRTSYSPNIKECQDFSCAVFDAHAELVAQEAHIPVHLGAMPLSVGAAIQRVPKSRAPAARPYGLAGGADGQHRSTDEQGKPAPSVDPLP